VVLTGLTGSTNLIVSTGIWTSSISCPPSTHLDGTERGRRNGIPAFGRDKGTKSALTVLYCTDGVSEV